MSALELLAAEMRIVCRETETWSWTLDDAWWVHPLAPFVMTPRRMRERLSALVDVYVQEGSINAREEALMRETIDRAIRATEAILEERLGRKATKCEQAASAPSSGARRP